MRVQTGPWSRLLRSFPHGVVGQESTTHVKSPKQNKYRDRPKLENLTWRSCILNFRGTVEALVHRTAWEGLPGSRACGLRIAAVRSAEALAGGSSPSSKASS